MMSVKAYITPALSMAIVGLSIGIQPLRADDQGLQETLLRMEQLLEQQQAELESQRKELAEQRVLIQQLQRSQKTLANQNEPSAVDVPSVSQSIVPEEQKPATEIALEGTISPESRSPESAEVAVVIADSSDSNIGQKQALAELARRESEGPDAAEAEAEASLVQEDRANTVYDPNFPGAWHLPGTTSTMKIAGYVNMALVNSFDPMLISDRFIVGSIPPEGSHTFGAESGTDVTASQTRINYEIREETNYGTLRAFIEADFEGAGDTFRLRHAFGQYLWGLAGKTWSTLMDLESRPEEVDFEGINGMILSRQAQLRVFPNFKHGMSLKLSVEDPRTDIANGLGVKGHGDLVMSVDRLKLSGFSKGSLSDWNSRIAVILRDLKGEGLDNIDGDSAFGWGITTSGRKAITMWTEDDFILWQLSYGKGLGRYLNDLSTVGGGDAVFDPEGKLRPLPVFAGYVSYQHTWARGFWLLDKIPGKMRSNLTFSWVDIDNFSFQDDLDYNSTLRASANIIYLPTPHFRVGAEFLWGQRKNKDGGKGTATQIQISARYDF